MQQAQAGFLKRVWVALVGEQDPVKAQLREMSRQGAGMARVGNACALLLVILFSLISFSALAKDDFDAFLASWQSHHINVLAGIFTLIVPAMVLAMDYGMLYAASMIRRLKSRHSGMDEKLFHYGVLWGVVVLEAGTYIYAAALYEHPATLVAWALIAARATGAPLLSVYLSMAQAIPVSPRDILAQAELQLGVGILQRVHILAGNPDATITDLAAMYQIVAVASDSDHKKLGDLVNIAGKTDVLPDPEVKVIVPPKTPPTNGGQRVDISPIIDEVDDDDVNGYTQPDLRIARFTESRSARNGNHRNEGTRKHRDWEKVREEAYDILDAMGGLDDRGKPPMNIHELQQHLGVRTRYANRAMNEYIREQLATRLGKDIALPQYLDDGEMMESGLWVAK